MSSSASEQVPQIVAITPLTSDGVCSLRRTVRQHLGLKAGGVIRLALDDEILFAAGDASRDGESLLPTSRSGRLELPDEVLRRLGSPLPAYLALVQRPEAVALKALSVASEEAGHVRFYDLETTDAVTRCIDLNPMPARALPALTSSLAATALRYDVVTFLAGRRSLHAWAARRVLGVPDTDDEGLAERLIEERIGSQGEDGAWGEGNTRVVRTARVLGELADLGLDRDAEVVQRGVDWLMARPTSKYNPGQWFAYDDLVPLQAEVIAEREAMTHGTRPRFRALRAGETRNVMAGHDLIRTPCGPRIMWPSGLVLDALLRLGYEDAPRVQTVLQLLITEDWCECAYQHGTSSWPQRAPFTGERLEAFEQACIEEYRMAGLPSADELLQRDLSHQPIRFLRVSQTRTGGVTSYDLEPELHIQGCEFITTRAMSTVSDPDMRRFAEAHLWRFAGCQLADGTFPRESHGTGFGQLGILSVFARYPHHPAAQIVLLRAVPWVIAAQRADGAWEQPVGKKGREDPRADAASRAAISVLKAVDGLLPPGFW